MVRPQVVGPRAYRRRPAVIVGPRVGPRPLQREAVGVVVGAPLALYGDTAGWESEAPTTLPSVVSAGAVPGV
jgi:hypothetical protein